MAGGQVANCTECGEVFTKAHGRECYCSKSCRSAVAMRRKREWRRNNPELFAEQKHRAVARQTERERAGNPKVCGVCGVEYSITNRNWKYCSDSCADSARKEQSLAAGRRNYQKKRGYMKEYLREYVKRPDVADRLRAYYRERQRSKSTDGTYRLHQSMAHAVSRGVTGGKMGVRWEALVGYSTAELVEHLESLFLDGMTWDNYGRGGWHVDHVVPLSWFPIEGPDCAAFNMCWSLQNLQPLWAHDNIAKGNRFVG